MNNINSSYIYKVFPVDHILLIIDMWDTVKSGITVTNNIENIIKEMSATEKTDFSEYKVIYRDTDNLWDEFDQKTGEFNVVDYNLVKELTQRKVKQTK